MGKAYFQQRTFNGWNWTETDIILPLEISVYTA